MSLLVKHFVKEPKILVQITSLEISEAEKQKLTESIILLYHQQLLNKFLEKLDETSKKAFLELHLSASHEETISFLQEKIDGIENIVERAIEEIDNKIAQDLESLRGEKN